MIAVTATFAVIKRESIAALEAQYGAADAELWSQTAMANCNQCYGDLRTTSANCSRGDSSDSGGCDGDQVMAVAQCDSSGGGGPGGCDGDQ